MTPAQETILRWREDERGILQYADEQFQFQGDPWQEKALLAFASPMPEHQRISLQACGGPGNYAMAVLDGVERNPQAAMATVEAVLGSGIGTKVVQAGNPTVARRPAPTMRPPHAMRSHDGDDGHDDRRHRPRHIDSIRWRRAWATGEGRGQGG